VYPQRVGATTRIPCACDDQHLDSRKVPVEELDEAFQFDWRGLKEEHDAELILLEVLDRAIKVISSHIGRVGP